MDHDPTHSDSDSQRRRAAPALVGRRIGNYKIRRLIAQGGMGAVYEAFHEGLRRPVALKTLLGGLESSHEDVQRFLNEARVLARLDHPNIVPVLDVGESNGVLFLAMELIRGQTLYDLIRAQGTLDEDMALDFVRQAALGLQHAHQHGVLHRDLKPANVLLESNGTARLTDFGVAKASGNQRLTATGTALGTPNYMSPEQAMGKNEELDARSDVWGLGAILYECLTGLPPFNRGSAVETMQAIVREDVPPPRTHVPGLSQEIDAMCMKCLTRDRNKRYGSAAELAEDIHRLVEGDTLQGVTAARPGVRQHALLFVGMLVFAAGLLALLLVVRPTSSRGLKQVETDAQAMRDARLASAREQLKGTPSKDELQALATSLDWSDLESAAMVELGTVKDDAKAAMARRGLGERDAFLGEAAPLLADVKLRLADGAQGAATPEQVPLLSEAAVLDPEGDAGRAARLSLSRALYAMKEPYARGLAVQELEDLAGVKDDTARGALLDLALSRADSFRWPEAAALAHALNESGGVSQAQLDSAAQLEKLALSLSPVVDGFPSYDTVLLGRDPEGPLLITTTGNQIRVYRVPLEPSPTLPAPIMNWALGSRSLDHAAVGDWDGNGTDDLFVAMSEGGQTNMGVVQLKAGPAGFRSITQPILGAHVQAIAGGDVNGDGRADFAVAQWERGFKSGVVMGGAKPRSVPLYPQDAGAPELVRAIAHVALADVDGDGRDEVLVGSSMYGDGTVDVRTLSEDEQTFASMGRLPLGAIASMTAYKTSAGAEGVIATLDWEDGPAASHGDAAWHGRDGVVLIGYAGGKPAVTSRWTYGADEEPTADSRRATTDLRAWIFDMEGEMWLARYARERPASSWSLEMVPVTRLSVATNASAAFSARRTGLRMIPGRVLCGDLDGDGRDELVLGNQLLGAGRAATPGEPNLRTEAPKPDRAATLLRVARQLQALGRDQLADETVLAKLRQEFPGSSVERAARLAAVDAILFQASDLLNRSSQAFLAAEPEEGARLRTLAREAYTRAAEQCERVALGHGALAQDRATAWAKCSFAYQAADNRKEAIRTLEQALLVRNLSPDWATRLGTELSRLRRERALLPLQLEFNTAAADGKSLGIMRPLRTRLTADGVSLLCTGEAMDAALVPLQLGAPLPVEIDAGITLHGNAWAAAAQVGVFTIQPSGQLGELTGFHVELSDAEGGGMTCAISVGGQRYRPAYRLHDTDRSLRLHLRLRPIPEGGIEAHMRVSDADGKLLTDLRVVNQNAAIPAPQLHYAGLVSPMAKLVHRACIEQPRWAMETRVTLKSMTVRSSQPATHPMRGVWSAHTALAAGRTEEALRAYQGLLSSNSSQHRQDALWYRGLARGRRGDANAHTDLVTAARSNPYYAITRLEDLAGDLLEGDERDLKTVSAALQAMEAAKNRPILNAIAKQIRGDLGAVLDPNAYKDASRKTVAAYTQMRNANEPGRWRWANTYRAVMPTGRYPRKSFPRVFDPSPQPLSTEAFDALLQTRPGDPQAEHRTLSRLRASKPGHALPMIRLADLYSRSALHGMAEVVLRKTLSHSLDLPELNKVHRSLAKVYLALDRVDDVFESLQEAKKAGATRAQLSAFEATLGRDPRFKKLLGS